MEAYDLSQITSSDFTPYVQQSLEIHFAENVVVQAVLKGVTELNGYSPLERKSFSVELQTIGDHRAHQQGIYRIVHATGKFLDVFMVPIGPDREGMRYEVLFS
ncbi:DUF6916 family protein [Dyadobacter fermentans]|uniref:DUF6916 domain-containing protein n=1 Tax=Dyadobacter fermentans (strain ATCC 700827 / DSM 18053 / CIP 107007 / KCTC 52180 / NS114) TaxID=471854 RepID=C6W6X9_DYAFD|nr:hypothetical protein [Dyadobacter fermentans]ACT92588.1 conserved hypothetical protein [Dyadobacter fermentans DSM 18053]